MLFKPLKNKEIINLDKYKIIKTLFLEFSK